MQKIIDKYQQKIEQLNVFEKQTLKTLIDNSTSNGMSRFFLVFNSENNDFSKPVNHVRKNKWSN